MYPALPIPDGIRQYLNLRGITDKMIQDFKIGYTETGKGGWITIPVRKADGTVFHKLRAVPGSTASNKYAYDPAGSEAELYGRGVLTLPNVTQFIICEGEFDAMLLNAHNLPAVTSTSGSQSFKEEWCDLFPQNCHVILCFDNDDAGRSGRKKLRGMLHDRRADINVSDIRFNDEGTAKGYDVSDFFRDTGKDGFVPSLLARVTEGKEEASAEETDGEATGDGTGQDAAVVATGEGTAREEVKAVSPITSWNTSIQETIRLIKGTDASKICTYPIPALNEVLGGIGRSEVVVIAGQSGEGKSDLLRLTAEENARRGRHVHMYQFEMDKDENIRRFLLRELNRLRTIDSEPPVSALDLYLNKITPWDHARLDKIMAEEEKKDFPLFTYGGKPLTVTQFLEGLTASLKTDHPPELIALDHIHYFAGDEGAQEAESLSLAMREIRQWSRETHVPVILAAHLRRQSKKNEEPSPQDIYGSSNILKEATTCILLKRNNQETTFSVWKSRVGADYKRFDITYDNTTKMWSGKERNMRSVFDDAVVNVNMEYKDYQSNVRDNQPF